MWLGSLAGGASGAVVFLLGAILCARAARRGALGKDGVLRFSQFSDIDGGNANGKPAAHETLDRLEEPTSRRSLDGAAAAGAPLEAYPIM